MTMTATDFGSRTTGNEGSTAAWPADVREALAALTNQFPPMMERRKVGRDRYYAQASLVHETAEPNPSRLASTSTVYVRDANMWAVGFISSQRLESHGRAVVSLTAPDGSLLSVRCLVRRCREVAPGWFDGVIEFDQPQAAFSKDSLKRCA